MLRLRLLQLVLALLALDAPAQQLQPEDCALLVVSTGLKKYGAKDLGMLYEFVQKAGAALPHKQLVDCYAEIQDLGDDGATPAGIVAALGRLGAKYRAVDLILHTHGKPFEMVCTDGPVDVVELAIATNAELAARAAAAAKRPGLEVTLRFGARPFLAAAGGGGFGLGTAASGNLAACRFRLLPTDGDKLGDGTEVTVATRTGHYLVVRDGELAADGDAKAATKFTVVTRAPELGNGVKLALRVGDRCLQLDGDGEPGLGAGPGELELRLAKPAPALAVTPLPAAARAHLRCVLTTACFGATEAPAWLNLGFCAAAGSRGVSADTATSFPAFLHFWARGDSFEEAVAAANRSDPLGAQDRIAAQRFHEVDSQRVVLGDGELDRCSPCR